MAFKREWPQTFLEPHWQADFLLTQKKTENIISCMTDNQARQKIHFRKDRPPILEGTCGVSHGS